MAYQFKADIDTEAFYYDPSTDYALNKLINSHPDFQQNLGYELEKRKKKILRYIILNYDMNTPLRRKHSNYFKRKVEAAKIAGFKYNKKEKRFANCVENILISKDDVVNAMIVRYVMYFHNQDYLRLVIFNEWLGNIARKEMSKGDIEKKNIDALNEISKGIEELTNKIFGTSEIDEESKELKQQLYKAMEEEKESLHPDEVAEQLQNDPNLFQESGDWMKKAEEEISKL